MIRTYEGGWEHKDCTFFFFQENENEKIIRIKKKMPIYSMSWGAHYHPQMKECKYLPTKKQKKRKWNIQSGTYGSIQFQLT